MPNNGRPRVAPRRTIPRASFDELEQALRIDEHELRRCCVQHAELMYQIGRQLAEYESRRDATKQELAETEARASKQIRHAAEVADVKITVGEVQAEVALTAEVIDLSAQLLQLGEAIGQRKALRDAYIHRKDMLKELVSLYLTDYYSDPVRGGEAQVRNIRDAATEGLQRAYRERNARGRNSNQEE